MTANLCVACGRPTPDGYACVACCETARRQLAEIADLTEAARDVMYRQTSTGGSHSPPGPRDLLDYGAGARLDAVQTALTGWARVVAEERTGAVWVAMEGDTIEQAAHWLADQLEWLRHRGETTDPRWTSLYALIPDTDDLDPDIPPLIAAQALNAIAKASSVMRRIVAAPAGRVYLGPCGAPVVGQDPPDDVYAGCPNSGYCLATWDCHAGKCEPKPPPTCDGDIYGKPDKAAAYCGTCGAAYDQAERRVQVAAMVEGRGYRASVIAHAYGISADTIRGWAWVRRDGQGEPLNDPKLKPVGRDGLNRPLYLVSDVLVLNEQAEQRRRQRVAQAAQMGA